MMSWLRPKSTRDTQSRIDQLVSVDLPAADRACQIALDSEDDPNAWAVADKRREELQVELRRLKDLLPGQSQREAAEAEAAAARFVGRPAPKPYKPERFEPLVGSPPPFGGAGLPRRFNETDLEYRDRQKGIIAWRHCPAEGDLATPYQGTPRWVLPSERPDLAYRIASGEGR